MTSFKIISLGCKVNSYEANAIRQNLIDKGYQECVSNPEIIVINTCSVTAVADQKSRQIIRRERRTNGHAVIAVMGCFSQKNGEFVASIGANIVVGTSNRNKLIGYIEKYILNHENIIDIDNDVFNLKYEHFNSFAIPDSTRAYIKIEDGCNNFCTYCTIPYTRGNVRSRDKDDIINEIKFLISKGYKEFVLTGIHLAHYGLDLKNITFSDLVEKIVKIPGLYRLRISSIEESEIDNKFIDLLAKYDCIADHLHIPLQSGSSKVLKSMNRKYNVDEFFEKVKAIRKVRPNISITTDVIVGFPGESEDDFKTTYDFIKKINFAELHVFPFSAREGTIAYSMKDQIAVETKNKRVDELLKLSKTLNDNYKKLFLGNELEVILEERNKHTGLLTGLTSNYLRLNVDLPDSYIGKVIKLKVE